MGRISDPEARTFEYSGGNRQLGCLLNGSAFVVCVSVRVEFLFAKITNSTLRGGSVCVANVAAKKLVQSLSLFLVLGPGLQGCHSQKRGGGPSIEFTHIPPAAQGGPQRVDTISGRVRNARPKQQIVIYAHSGQWWVQPEPDHFIPIRADSTWSTKTHLGFEYAAL